jgi:hypothetical protein
MNTSGVVNMSTNDIIKQIISCTFEEKYMIFEAFIIDPDVKPIIDEWLNSVLEEHEKLLLNTAEKYGITVDDMLRGREQ